MRHIRSFIGWSLMLLAIRIVPKNELGDCLLSASSAIEAERVRRRAVSG